MNIFLIFLSLSLSFSLLSQMTFLFSSWLYCYCYLFFVSCESLLFHTRLDLNCPIGNCAYNRALRSDLQLLRRKGAIKVGGSLDRPIIDSKSACARCCLVFGYINRGAECNLCHLRVCRECRIDVPFSKNDWVCIICYKEMWVLSMAHTTLCRLSLSLTLSVFVCVCLCLCFRPSIRRASLFSILSWCRN